MRLARPIIPSSTSVRTLKVLSPKFLRGSLKVNKTKTSVIVVLAALLLMLPFVVAHGAGGRIEGKVTDPKGAVVIGAAITVTDPISNQTFAGHH